MRGEADLRPLGVVLTTDHRLIFADHASQLKLARRTDFQFESPRERRSNTSAQEEIVFSNCSFFPGRGSAAKGSRKVFMIYVRAEASRKRHKHKKMLFSCTLRSENERQSHFSIRGSDAEAIPC